MSSRTTDTVLMIRPAAFGSNPETADSNAFQHMGASSTDSITPKAQGEFDDFAQALRSNGVNVIMLEDTLSPTKPDAVFPNNWFSTHSDGEVVLYPMLSRARRLERRADDLVRVLEQAGFNVTGVRTDLVFTHEAEGRFLEGTGSMVLDRANRVAYACRSARTNERALADWCAMLGYESVVFDARDAAGQAYYHTNVMLSIGSTFAIVCAESIDDLDRDRVMERLASNGRRIVTITRKQAGSFAANVLELRTNSGGHALALSSAAHKALSPAIDEFQELGLELVGAPIPTIERFGGGSARCMLAEIFLPKA